MFSSLHVPPLPSSNRYVALSGVVITPARAGITVNAGGGVSNHDVYLGCADTSGASKPNANTADRRSKNDGLGACSTFRSPGTTGCVDDCKNGGYCCQIGIDRTFLHAYQSPRSAPPHCSG